MIHSKYAPVNILCYTAPATIPIRAVDNAMRTQTGVLCPRIKVCQNANC